MHKRNLENVFIALPFMRSNLLKTKVWRAGSFRNRTMLLGPKAHKAMIWIDLFGSFYTGKGHGINNGNVTSKLESYEI